MSLCMLVLAAGCIPSDFWDLGVAVGPLNVPSNLYYPVKLVITRWSDGSSVSPNLRRLPLLSTKLKARRCVVCMGCPGSLPVCPASVGVVSN